MPAASSVTARMPAKINLSLDVGPVRADGYHPLRTVYQAIGVWDEVTVQPAERLSLVVHGATRDLGPDEDNLAVRAVRALAAAAGREPDVAVEVRKRIPVAAGMAGGSADAAGALLATAVLWDLLADPTAPGAAQVDLFTLAAQLGSDVPFLLTGGTALGTGRGEVTEALPDGPELTWVVAELDAALPTPAVYRELDRLRSADLVPAEQGTATEAVLSALGLVRRPWSARPGSSTDEWLPATAAPRRDEPGGAGAGQRSSTSTAPTDGWFAFAPESNAARQMAAATGNDLQAAAVSLLPVLGDLLAHGRAAGAGAALVSGSGPTVLFTGPGAVLFAIEQLLSDHPRVAGVHRTIGPVRPHVWTD